MRRLAAFAVTLTFTLSLINVSRIRSVTARASRLFPAQESTVYPILDARFSYAAVVGTEYRQPEMTPHSISQPTSVQVIPYNTFFHTEGRDIVADSPDSTGEKVKVDFRGVNLIGLEFGTEFNNRPPDLYPGELGKDYFQPRREDFIAIKNNGFNLARISFEWARLVPRWQPGNLQSPTLNQAYLDLLDQEVAWATEQQIYVVLDMHDFLKYWCDPQDPTCPNKQQCVDNPNDPDRTYQRLLEQTWKLLAEHYREKRAVLGFDIVNEPERYDPEKNTCRSDNWHEIAQGVVNTIREVDSNHLIFVEGLNFSLASHWPVENGKRPFITDRVTPPRIVYSPHVYFDFNNSSHYDVPGEQTGPIGQWEYYVRDRLLPAIDWSKENNVPIYFGEMGVPCTTAWAEVMDYVFRNFVEPLRLSVTVWHYSDPERCSRSDCPLNIAGCSSLLDVLSRYPGRVYQNRESDDPIITQPDSLIYDDELINPWVNGSFHNLSLEFCAPPPVYDENGRCVIGVHFNQSDSPDSPNNTAGVKFIHLYGLDTRRWTVLRFRIFLSGAQQQNFNIWTTKPSRLGSDLIYPPESKRPELTKYLPLSQRQPGQWHTVNIPLRDIVDPMDLIINGIAFQNMGQTQEVFYLDDLRLINNPPTIIPVGVTRQQQGSPASNSTIANVSDPDQAANTLTVTVNGSSSATVNGVTVSGISISTTGDVTANIVAACTAPPSPPNATFTLTITDSASAPATATLNVTVTANSAPTLTYNNQSVAAGGSLTIKPATGPSDNGSINTIVVQSQGAYLGTISVNNSTGDISLGGAKPGGKHTITIQATDNCGLTTDTSFMLSIDCPAITLSPATLPDGTGGVPYSQTLTASGGTAPYRFAVTPGLPSGLMLSDDGLLSGTPNLAGMFAFTITATDANGCAGSRVYPLSIKRLVRALPGSQASVPIELVAGGNENALGFSLAFDPSLLLDPQVALGADAGGATLNVNASQAAQGRLGLLLALPAGQAFAAGTHQVVVVSFTVPAGTTATSTPLAFADQPVARELVDLNAQLLPATFTPTTVTITLSGYEADVAPRPNGNNNGAVMAADWVQVGRFAARLDTAAPGGEFQRADCAPRERLGDGVIGLADWVQAGRFAAGLDPVASAGGPTAPTSTPVVSAALSTAQAWPSVTSARAVRLVRWRCEVGQDCRLALELDAQGDENALALSLHFDPTQWRFRSASTGSDARDALLNLNTNQSSYGRLGLALALPARRTFASGTRQIVIISFSPLSDRWPSQLTIGFGDGPITRELMTATAQPLSVSFTIGAGLTEVHPLENVSAASFSETALASEAIAAAFGTGLATQTQVAEGSSLPVELAGTRVLVRDSEGVERLAPLFFVSPTQINYQMPPGTASGFATVIITSGDGVISIGTVQIASVSPGLFTFTSDGQGVPAAIVRRLRNNQELPSVLAAQLNAQNHWAALPIDLGPDADLVVLEMYGTGLRLHINSGSSVTVKIGGADALLIYAGLTPGLIGLDQVDFFIPRSLIGRGDVDIVLTVDGKAANTVKVNLK